MIYIIPKNIDSDNKKVLLVKKIHTNNSGKTNKQKKANASYCQRLQKYITNNGWKKPWVCVVARDKNTLLFSNSCLALLIMCVYCQHCQMLNKQNM